MATALSILAAAASLADDEVDGEVDREVDRRLLEWTLPNELVVTPAPAPAPPETHPSTSRESRAWRKTGLAYVDLPMRVRARVDASYVSRPYLSEQLARPYTARAGPSLDRDHVIESRLALTRPVSDRIELEIAWGGRTGLGGLNLLDFDRHLVGALIRIVP